MLDCIRRLCDTLAEMGCCNSKAGASHGFSLLPISLFTGLREAGGEQCKVGILARELSAYDFASEVFALEYTQQIVTASVGQVFGGRGGDLEGRTHNVPGEYATIQDAVDAARNGDVRARAALVYLAVARTVHLLNLVPPLVFNRFDLMLVGAHMLCQAVRIAPGRYKEAVVVNKRILLVGVCFPFLFRSVLCLRVRGTSWSADVPGTSLLAAQVGGEVGDTVLEGPDESIFFAASAMPTVRE